MGKRKRRAAIATTELRAGAERHEFSIGGYLGHDSEYRVNVNERTALGVDVVYACVRTIADAVADAAWGEWRGSERLDDSRLTRRPMSTMTRRAWAWRVAATMALYNVCHLERVGEDPEGVALSLVPLRPGQLTRMPNGRYMVDGQRELAPDRVRSVRRAWWPSVTEEIGTVLALARSTFAAAWAADAYRTNFWENGGAPAIVLTSDQDIDNTAADKIADRWSEKRRAGPGKPAVLGKGAKVQELGADMGAEGASDAADRLGSSVARYFGVPSWIVNVVSAAGSMVYSNTETAGLDLKRYTLRGYLGPIEDELSDELPGDYIGGRHVVLDVSQLTQGTLKERYEAFDIATGHRPWMTPAEVRAELNLPPDRSLDPNGAPAPAMEAIPA